MEMYQKSIECLNRNKAEFPLFKRFLEVSGSFPSPSELVGEGGRGPRGALPVVREDILV